MIFPVLGTSVYGFISYYVGVLYMGYSVLTSLLYDYTHYYVVLLAEPLSVSCTWVVVCGVLFV